LRIPTQVPFECQFSEGKEMVKKTNRKKVVLNTSNASLLKSALAFSF
jgi:hypothetical protein